MPEIMNSQIIVDFDDIKSIKSAEKKKAMLENKGYKLDSTKKLGFSKYIMHYSKLKEVV